MENGSIISSDYYTVLIDFLKINSSIMKRTSFSCIIMIEIADINNIN